MSQSGPDPIGQLRRDREKARSLEDPCAALCTLANVDADGIPHARTLVLRDLGERLGVFVNGTSPKFPAIAAGPVSVVVWLPSISIQYRLACRTEPIPRETVAESWQFRPEIPKRMDWLYESGQAQSTVLESREALLDLVQAIALGADATAPVSASGFFLDPHMMERLDLATPDGVHDRRRYTLGNPVWKEEVLVP
jgi:pyridoxine/pyridoxamine 5'-phosphate oxidase